MNNTHNSLKSRGFTLTEVLVALSIFSMVVPLVLGGTLFCLRAMESGIQKSNNIAGYRLFEQHFATHIMNSQKEAIRPVGGSANTIIFSKFDGGTSSWVTEFMQYDPSDKTLSYYKNGLIGNKKVLLSDVNPTSWSAKVFSINNGNVSCDLLIGKDERYDVLMSLSMTPRN